MPEPSSYQRLTFARSRSAFSIAFMSRSSLWRGEDHLLGVDSNGYTETYKRFYFRDIQAIMLVASKRRAIINWILLIPTVPCLAWLLTLLVSRRVSDTGTLITLVILISIFALPLLINNLLGPTCTCRLRTAVQIEEVPSLNRLRRARKVLGRIRPLIAAAQGGEMAPELISTRMRELFQTQAIATPAETIADQSGAPPAVVS